ncbi:hypothetical protein SAMN04488116_3515 [Flagellimonas flava]|uniref:Uncharacterized protein n=1 Tax=Flagellimonas flava TaxID=570519 RepID=A0A1M5Q5C4_9FLAO|nr:hypothetical protein SAMN04488116_3515 [Allomuricauda flava]
MQFLKNAKKVDKIGFIFLVSVLLCVTIFHLIKNKSVADNRTHTIGKIAKLKHIKKSSYYLKYTYLVDGNKYIGKCGVRYFECSSENHCIGSEIDVFYSSVEPKYSQVDLRQFEKYKTEIYLIE